MHVAGQLHTQETWKLRDPDSATDVVTCFELALDSLAGRSCRLASTVEVPWNGTGASVVGNRAEPDYAVAKSRTNCIAADCLCRLR